MSIEVCLVELKIPENIGFIARVMKNFGFDKLCLYNCEIDERTYITASHARDILDKATIIDDLHSFLSDKNLIIGTTGITGLKEERYLRRPIFYPDELKEHLKGKYAGTTILFGREDYGLSNEEIEMCDMLVNIPTSPEYPVMNVSHSVAIILYELRKEAYKLEEKCYATSEDIERLVRYFEELLVESRYPPHRLPRTLLMLKRVNKRALLTKNEFTTYLGVIRKIKIYLEELHNRTK
ncbi:RNA methyltransferase [Archaeoglobales archaeon]|nr:MAG: RNA methyltransferase [Archaeoglobales archaeon]